MRITNGMLSATFMQDLNRNLRGLAKYQHQLASGKRVSRPSDDPVAIVKSLRLRSDLGDIEQFVKNADHALAWLNTTETALAQAGDVLQRARELAVYGANGTLPQESRDAIAEEVKQLFDQMVQIANTSYAGQYVFAGTETKTQPFTGDLSDATPAVTYAGNDGPAGEKRTETGTGQTLAYNLDGRKAFASTGSGDPFQVFESLKSLYLHLKNSQTQEVSSQDIGELSQAIDHLLAVRAEVGARVNRLELTKSRLNDANINFTDLLSKAEDVDVAQVIMELKNQENVYRAALATGARIIQPTLVDFLR
jgi:flagellar hook-associated protein 3 FlgL